MLTKTLSFGFAGMALAAVTLSGCGGSSTPGAQSAPPSSSASASSAATTEAAPSSSAPTAAESSPVASPSASSAPADVKEPCDVLSASDIEDLTGVAVKKGTKTSVSGSNLCTWTPQKATLSAVVFTAQEGPIPGTLDQIKDQLESQFDGKATTVSVSGADDALLITGKKSSLSILDVVAQKDQVFYQVLAASPRSVSNRKDDTVKITEALIKG